MVPRMSRPSPLMIVLRLLLLLALVAPHGLRAEDAGGMTLVICGAEGVYEIALGDAPPPDHDHRHDCCILCGASPQHDPAPTAPCAVAAGTAAVAWTSIAPLGHPPGLPTPRGPPSGSEG
jgi:hypothetical protein